MSNRDIENELFDDYLNLELNAKEKADFETRLSTDAVFKKSFELHNDTINHIKAQGNLVLKKKLQGFEKTQPATKDAPLNSNINGYTTSDSSKTFSLRKYIPAIAASLLLVVAGTFFFLSNSVNTGELYSSNFKSYPNDLVTIDRSEGPSNALQEAMVKYESQDFQSALEAISKISSSKSNRDMDFYKAISLMGTKDHKAAEKLLSELLALKDYKYREATNWYAALNHLKLGNINEAKNLLTQIINSNQKYQRTASKKILEEL